MQTRKNDFQIDKICNILLRTKCMDLNVLIDKTPINCYTIPNEHFNET